MTDTEPEHIFKSTEAKRRANKKYYENNKDKVKEINNAWKQNNADMFKMIMKKQYEKNKEVLLRKKKEYIKNHMEAYIEYQAKYRERQRIKKQGLGSEFNLNIENFDTPLMVVA
jgi:hypothetical protein